MGSIKLFWDILWHPLIGYWNAQCTLLGRWGTHTQVIRHSLWLTLGIPVVLIQVEVFIMIFGWRLFTFLWCRERAQTIEIPLSCIKSLISSSLKKLAFFSDLLAIDVISWKAHLFLLYSFHFTHSWSLHSNWLMYIQYYWLTAVTSLWHFSTVVEYDQMHRGCAMCMIRNGHRECLIWKSNEARH